MASSLESASALSEHSGAAGKNVPKREACYFLDTTGVDVCQYAKKTSKWSKIQLYLGKLVLLLGEMS